MQKRDVIVVGAGPAGLSTALSLSDLGVRPLVVDAAAAVASAWRGRYDRLRLNSPRTNSHLPGRRYPKGTPMFPSRDAVVAHFEDHSRSLEVEFGTRVERIARNGDGWSISMGAEELTAPQVVVATGYNGRPHVPDWPGREAFAGELLHSSEYRSAAPFAGRRVLVVGAGCSGMEIAYDLAAGGAEEVWLAVRTPPNIVLRAGPGGLPGDYVAQALLHLPVGIADRIARFGRRMDVGDLSDYGLPVPEEGVFARLRRLGVAPAIVDPEVIQAIRDRRFTVVAGIERLDGPRVQLTDGEVKEADAVVCATGFRTGLESLVADAAALTDGGRPRAHGEQAAAPGLRFVGFVTRPGMLGYMAKEGRRTARAIARELAQG